MSRLRRVTWADSGPVRALQGAALCGGGLLLLAFVFWVVGLKPASGWGTMLLGIGLVAGFFAYLGAYAARPGTSLWTSPMDRTLGERPRREGDSHRAE